jgi:biopolymer transport protein ExbD
MKVKLHTPLEEIQVPIIPMIDVIFCILTFFLIAALQFTRQQAINVDLPKASTGTTSATNSPDRLYVEIKADGQIDVQNYPVRRQDLEQQFKQYTQTHPSGLLVLNASRASMYNDVIQILDLMRKVGGNRVALGIVPDISPSDANSGNLPSSTSIPPNNIPVPGNYPQAIPQQAIPQQIPSAPDQIPLAPGQTTDQGVLPIIPNGTTVPQVPLQGTGNRKQGTGRK